MNNLSIYEVIVNAGLTAPFFGQYGGEIQYDLEKSIAKLIAEGFLRRL